MNNSNHPIWSFLRFFVCMAALTITLWANASNFDSTEMWTIGTMFLIGAGTEGVSQLACRFGKKKE